MQTTAHSRPLGPRSIARASSPSSVSLPETAPLIIRKTPKYSPSLSPPGNSSSRSPTPSLGLQIPSVHSRPTTPKPTLRLGIPPQSNGASSGQTNSGYYGGPPVPAPNSSGSEHPDDMTIVPLSTCVPQTQTQRRFAEPLADIRDLLNELETRTSSSSLTPDAEEDAVPNPASPRHFRWGDDVLEELSRLGEGAGGAVHKVKDKRTGKIMARKTITTREAPMKQLLRELSIISSTEHVNIILFHGAYMSPSSSEVKILMEFCEGGSLEAVGKRIKERGAVVGEKIAGRLAEGVLQGLGYLHSKKTIHRDIKPSNILLSREGIVKLCDFGVSGELVDSMAGTFTGTSFYMAPERISGDEYTIRSDVWSTGISLLELVQNRFPFPNDLPPIELMMYITAGEPPRLDDEPGVQWSEHMKDFIRQTLTLDAQTRPTPKDMLAHPWIVGVMKEEVHMARWIRQVWGWPKSSRRSRDNGSISRPTTGGNEPPSPSARTADSLGDTPTKSGT